MAERKEDPTVTGFIMPYLRGSTSTTYATVLRVDAF